MATKKQSVINDELKEAVFNRKDYDKQCYQKNGNH